MQIDSIGGKAADTAFPQEGRNCWRIASADRFAVIIDGADYFKAARAAMLKAERSILLVGWDFDARIRLGEREAGDDGPEQLGDFILWLADRKPSLEIRLLRWQSGAVKAMFRGRTLWWVLRWKAHPRITLRLDSKHPLASSHHQKILAIDDRLAFCGGIDMIMQRWDDRDHLDNNPRRVSPFGKQLPPWHDATSVFDGEAAAAIGELARARWLAATGETLPAVRGPATCWPDHLAPDFTGCALAISRSAPKMDDVVPVHEVEDAYIDMIARAKSVLYAESQYFASRRVAQALAEKLSADNSPEVVIVTPHSAEGWLEPLAMDTARATLVKALQALPHGDKLRLYHPVTASGAEIYVHAKIMVVDDQILRIGSSNLNNRSMRLDTECDVMLSCDLTANSGEEPQILRLRNSLLAEHLGVSPEKVERVLAECDGSVIAMIETLRGQGRSLVPYEIPELNDLEQWLAENEILDPNGPDQVFEAPAKRGLLKGWGHLRRFWHSKT